MELCSNTSLPDQRGEEQVDLSSGHWLTVVTKKRECDSAVVELIYAKKALMIVSTHLIRIYPGNFLLEEGSPVVDQEFHGGIS